ncbi:hypothetical protein HZH66_012924 [Vespula vulgaris]|uniref:Uncharacterized protein n=1 Tax=Vespula vulgaris TaxID=7454 RepID=A0A834J830_VESVU|nr:hypothetical protein HZH66_012924 [Vespula vulgaris]
MGQVSATNKEVYYIPRHVVIKESSVTTNLRAVFDTSAKSNTEVSRNNILMIRPNIQDEIYQQESPKALSVRCCKTFIKSFLTIRYLKQLADDKKTSFSRIVAMLKNDFLLDDLTEISI